VAIYEALSVEISAEVLFKNDRACHLSLLLAPSWTNGYRAVHC